MTIFSFPMAVSLPGKKKVVVKVLRGTGELLTFVFESVLLFYSNINDDFGMCPELPVEGVGIILGNNHAGEGVCCLNMGLRGFLFVQ